MIRNKIIYVIPFVFVFLTVGSFAQQGDVIRIAPRDKPLPSSSPELDNEQRQATLLIGDARDAIAACNLERFVAALEGLRKLSRNLWARAVFLEQTYLAEMLAQLTQFESQLSIPGGSQERRDFLNQQRVKQNKEIDELEGLIKMIKKFCNDLGVREEELIDLFEKNCHPETEGADEQQQTGSTGQQPQVEEKEPTPKTVTRPSKTAQVDCPPCRDIANQLADAQEELAYWQNFLEATESSLNWIREQLSQMEKTIQKLENILNKQTGKGASGVDPATGDKLSSRYNKDGQIEVTVTHPNGQTETTTYDSKALKRIKDQLDELRESQKQFQDRQQNLEGDKNNAQVRVDEYKTQVEQLKKELEECIKKYCKETRTATGISTGTGTATGKPVTIQIFYDRADCYFGGGTTFITIPAGGGPVIVQAPGPGGTAPPPPPQETPGGSTPGTTTKEPGTAGPTQTGTPEQDSPTKTTSGGEGTGIPTPPPMTTRTKPPKEEKPPDDPRDEPAPPTIVIIVKATEEAMQQGAVIKKDLGNAQLKIPGQESPLPVANATKDDYGYDDEPDYFEKQPDGTFKYSAESQAVLNKLATGESRRELINLDLSPQEGNMLAFRSNAKSEPTAYLTGGLDQYLKHSYAIGDTQVVVIQYPASQKNNVAKMISGLSGLAYQEPNPCRVIKAPNDPFYLSKSSWKQTYDDQWAIKRVGFTQDPQSAWRMNAQLKPVVVAVVDTGLDWNHQDISWENLWSNPREIPENGKDDDKNGYVDDVIGYDFFRRNNMPWDQNGHGTFVTGIIAATQGNQSGIAGINPKAKIMVLKALNGFGHTRASYLAEAITYAANHGARVINISVGGTMLTRTEQLAIDYAYSKGAVVVVAAGNEAQDVSNVSPAGLKNVIAVAASDINDKRAAYSNWGPQIDIVAPGNDVLSLRARRTDLMRDAAEVKYTAGAAYVGVDKRYYRASGTSFSTPIVAATASLIFGLNPELTNQEVERMIVQSSKDVETIGRDQYTGYGMLDARAAISADPQFYIDTDITAANVINKGGTFVQIEGTVAADRLKTAWLELGMGEDPKQWKKTAAPITKAVQNGALGLIPASELQGSAKWTVRLVAEHANGKQREARFRLDLE